MPETWVATSFGALDIRDLPSAAESGLELMLLPTQPSEPIGLHGEPAALWRRLSDGPIPDDDLTPEQQVLVREFAQFGLASRDKNHPARTRSIPTPWLVSPMHELVYSMVTHVAREVGVEIVFIKGPALFKQGLREREHSGDVDLWAHPDGVGTLANALTEWGWTILPTMLDGLPLKHSETLQPSAWGCEMDIHYAFPGVGASGADAFGTLRAGAESIEFAGTPAPVPAKETHAVISALHLYRPELTHRRTNSEADRAVRVLSGAGSTVIGAAERLLADASLAPVLATAFPDDFTGPISDIPANWEWRMQGTRFRAYRAGLGSTPLRRQVRFAREFIWPTREQLTPYGITAASTATEALRARLRRLRQKSTQLFAEIRARRSP